MTTQELPPQDERIEIEGSDGVVLRQLIPEDAQPYFDLIEYDRAHLSQFDDDTAEKYKTVEDVLESIVNPKNPYKFRFGIFANEKMVGSINMTPSTPMKQAEIGYWVGKEHTGNGYAGKALNTFIPFAFSRPAIERLYAKVAIGNVPSQKTLLKTGFRFGGQDDYWWYFDLTKNRFTGA